MKDKNKPMCAVMVKDFVEFSKWLKDAPDKNKIIYRPVFSLNSSVGIYFDAMIFTSEFWEVEDAKQIHLYVSSRLKKCQRVDASNGILKKRPTRFLERAFGVFRCRDRG